MAEKRKILPPGYRPPVAFVLFYEQSVNKYFSISTSSTLCPKDLDLDTVKEMDQFVVVDHKVEYNVQYISHSSSQSEIQLKMEKLQKMLDSGKVIDEDTSFGFLDRSLEANVSKSHDSDSHDTVESINSASTSTDTITTSPTSLLSPHNELQQLISLQKQSNNLLEELIRGQGRLRRTISKCALVEKKSVATSALEPTEPVHFHGKDLVKIGASNLDMCQYGTMIARKMWNDEELKNGRLLPLRSKGRPSLSPIRSNIWIKAMKSRFSIDDLSDMKQAITAVNQLGSDIGLGKRKRLAPPTAPEERDE